MCKAVQHFRIFAKSLDCQTVVFLIQEKSGLLSVLDVHFIFYTILFNLNDRRKFFSDKSLGKFHSFLAADLCITSLIDTPDLDPVLCKNILQRLNDRSLKAVDPKCQRLYYQHVRKLIHNKARKKICLPEDHAAASDVYDFFAVFPGITDTLPQKVLIDLSVLISGEHTHSNLGIGVDKPSSHRITVKIVDQHNISVHEASHDRCDLIIIYPEAS